MNKVIIMMLLFLASCTAKTKQSEQPDFDFWVIKGKRASRGTFWYTIKPINQTEGGEQLGGLTAPQDWAEVGDSLIGTPAGLMRWKVVINPNHPDWGKSKEGSDE